MKKILMLISIVSLFFILCACNDKTTSSEPKSSSKFEVSTSKEESSSSTKPESSFKDEKDLQEYTSQLDNEIAKSFEIDLNEYIKVENFLNKNDPQNDKIAIIYNYITKKDLEPGDKKPSVYLEKSNNKNGIVLIQKADKSKKLISFQLDDSVILENAEKGIVQEKIVK
ncbi:hypothetical protein [Petroclostridium sp. X23]|uniref:hypothetical protein n=1 Tax=Petroclostridium sp. X23 TaxID=3045146 RepID=UPI0024AE0EFB|nr:hypothetical protein [Petroclostridium sp. X23]WHH56920.1 hypothetical protein QKW49_13780 [Petroclostridium sp. X23]